jgi:hypothetical protein
LLLEWFVRGGTSTQIASETGLERKRVLRALTFLRKTLVGRRRASRTPPPSAGRPVIAVSVIDGIASANVLPESIAQEIRAQVRRRKPPDPALFAPHQAVIYRGRFYRSPTAANQRDARFGQLEAFWSYLQQRLRSKGGVRRSRADLYLAEYTWRFNHRRLTRSEQVNDLITLLRTSVAGGVDVS